MNELFKNIINILIILSLTISFAVFSYINLFAPTEIIDVNCYDRYSNIIINSNCIDTKIIEPYNTYSDYSFIFIIIFLLIKLLVMIND